MLDIDESSSFGDICLMSSAAFKFRTRQRSMVLSSSELGELNIMTRDATRQWTCMLYPNQ